jgi:hypothetical protein
MLHIEPMRWFSWDFTVERDGRPIAEIDISWWRERGELIVEGVRYEVTRKNVFCSDFTMHAPDGTVVASAYKPSIMSRHFELEHGGHASTVTARSMWSRTMDVLLDGRAAGVIAPRGAWTRRATADLADELPLPVQVFAIWLAVLLWKREQDAAVAAS